MNSFLFIIAQACTASELPKLQLKVSNRGVQYYMLVRKNAHSFTIKDLVRAFIEFIYSEIEIKSRDIDRKQLRLLTNVLMREQSERHCRKNCCNTKPLSVLARKHRNSAERLREGVEYHFKISQRATQLLR